MTFFDVSPLFPGKFLQVSFSYFAVWVALEVSGKHTCQKAEQDFPWDNLRCSLFWAQVFQPAQDVRNQRFRQELI